MNSKNQFEVSAADAADTCDVSAPEQSKDKAYEMCIRDRSTERPSGYERLSVLQKS